MSIRPKSQATKEYKTSIGKLVGLIITISLIVTVILLAFFLFVKYQSWRQQRAVVQESRQVHEAAVREARAEAQATAQAQTQQERELFSSPWILYASDTGSETPIWITHIPGSDELQYTYSFMRNDATHIVEGDCDKVDINRFECDWKQQTSRDQSSRGKLTLIRENDRLFSGFETYLGKTSETTGVTPIYVATSTENIPK